MPDRWGSPALLLLGAILTLTACPSPNQPTTPSTTVSYNLDSPAQTQIQEVPGPVSPVQLTVNLGSTPHTLYLAFTNPSQSVVAALPQVTSLDIGRGEQTSPELAPGSTAPKGGLRDLPNAGRLPQPVRSAAARRESRSLGLARGTPPTPPAATSIYSPGSTRPFSYLTYTDLTSPSGSGTATLTVQATNTTQNRIVNIWVLPGQSITTPMAQALADRFLAAGTATGSDIYSWITGVFGREYDDPGAAVTPDLITPTGEVDIVLADLNPDRASQTSFVYGYYYAANNFQTYMSGGKESSNGRIAFFLDGPTFATASGDTWDLSDSHPADIVSTLAHEFQHMINFYQKDLLQGLPGTATWINEMASMEAEDLVADKLGVAGPRGVPPISGVPDETSGVLTTNTDRLAIFNGVYPRYSLTSWTGTVYDYSMAFSFGSWLARNYGGPALFRNIVQNNRTDEQAILDAIGTVAGKTETLPSLLRHWAGAILASGSGLPEGYNLTNLSGSTEAAFPFTLASAVVPSTNQAFTLGSINYFKYKAFNPATGAPSAIVGPAMATSFSGLTGIKPTGLYFLKAGSGLTGSHTFTLTIPAGVDLTLVAKVGP